MIKSTKHVYAALILFHVVSWNAFCDQNGFTTEQFGFFESYIRPILIENCYSCHASDTKQEGGLMLDSRSGWEKGGNRGPAIIPDDTDNSLLIQVISYTNPDLQMPPKSPLPDQIIDHFQRWVQMGAPDPRTEQTKPNGISLFDIKSRSNFWCYESVKATMPPEVQHKEWVANPIDQFILARLEEEGLTPADPADKRTLIRRMTYALTGLPPTPKEVDTFLAETSEDGYTGMVNRLLDSPHFGERWARHWMDLVRYAETRGHEGDYPIQNVWPYRDYLIRAFNNDIPYNQFVREHIAGDLLGSPRIHPQLGYNESVMGTAFYHLGEATHSPVDILEDEAVRIDNMIDVTSKTFLGLTVGCARCHDHKFDAISTKDYYSLFAIMANSRMTYASIHNPDKIADQAKTLRTEKSKIRQKLIDNWQIRTENLGRYLVATSRIRNQAKELFETKSQRHDFSQDLVIADFEGQDYGDWQATGEAFGLKPIRDNIELQKDVTSFKGIGFANSFSDGDKPQGKLTSPEFQVQRKFVNFLIGGGNHHNKTCINLVIDDQIVRTATGSNQAKMAAVTWDVSEFADKTAWLEIVDKHSGGWGHISLDHIVLTDLPTSPEFLYSEMAQQATSDAPNLEVGRLIQWANALKGTTIDKSEHPLHYWLKAIEELESKSPVNLQMLRKLKSDLKQRDGIALGDFRDGSFGDWYLGGVAFGQSPPAKGDILMSGRDRQINQLLPSIPSSVGATTQLPGALRSPTFTIEHDFINVHTLGRGNTIRIVLHNLQLIRDPIYGGLERQINNLRAQWQKFDLHRWKGHHAYIEILHNTGLDNFIAVDLVVAHNGKLPESFTIKSQQSSEQVLSFEELENLFDQRILSAFNDWQTGISDIYQLDLLNFLLQHKLLANSSDLNDSIIPYRQLESALPPDQRVVAMTDGNSRQMAVYTRGNPRNLAEPASARFLEVLAGSNTPYQTSSSGRLQLAEDIINPNNPLTSRVMVNRVWHHLFGRGIVTTVDNFGLLGDLPSHPQLLDYLADQFVSNGWSVKDLIRTIVSSNTYRMSSQRSPESLKVDPDNRLLQSMNIRRLEAEAVRDGMLAVSGRLDRKMYGQSEVVHLTPFMIGRGKPEQSGPLDGNGKRSIYIELRRNFLPDMMLAFDLPIPFTTFGRRNSTNVPAQALTLMNSPFVTQQAEYWASQLMKQEIDSLEGRIEWMYQQAYSRLPSEDEVNQAATMLYDQGQEYNIPESESLHDRRIWKDFGHVLFNSKEFIYIF
ncbi:MAG: PSD1 and planctomycete cytochrome C domain-containing protein [Candidatus Poribacteria bacterium]|jgi:hypothetical protein|nr:PSD1 and planctomycete cytochrome C domain-containing protein [Candidatus Poribacteria bacterium]MDP6749443.1 PSD1 and planctomycete cytochrome C domain-containing protein [Candidatus Poribacteria bacterium]MDP6999404.1 PSD1 and planctomycete cytochrome C domain-containing protein [Candidatus Poribacteria bacterium]